MEEIKNSDVIICNIKKESLIKWGLDFDTVKKINTSIIYAEITGFRNSNRVAYDVVLQAESGYISMNGTEKGELCKLPVAFIDLFAAHQIKEGILVAMLMQRNKLEPLKVSVSLYDAAISSLANQATNWLMAKQIPKPPGMCHPNIAPYGEIFICKDGKKLILAVGSDKQFQKLCELLQIDQVLENENYRTNQSRVKNRKKLQATLAEVIGKCFSDELLKQLIQQNIPAGLIRTVDEVFSSNEAKARIIESEKEGKSMRSVKGFLLRLAVDQSNSLLITFKSLSDSFTERPQSTKNVFSINCK